MYIKHFKLKKEKKDKKMNTPNLMPEMSEKFDIVMKHLMLAKKEMGSCVKKDATNPFHKSKYASLGAHLELCESTLDSHGLIMLQTVNGSHEKAILIATLCHPESGQWIKSYFPLPNPKNDSQGLGASVTYMRRYSINSMLGLTAEDDDGESACIRIKPETKGQAAPSSSKFVEAPKTNQSDMQKASNFPIAPQKLSPAQVGILKSLEKKLDAACLAKINKWLNFSYKTTIIDELPVNDFNKILGTYENAVKFMQSEKMELAHA